MREHFAAFSCIDGKSAACEEENCAKMLEDIGAGLVDGEDESAAFLGETLEYFHD